MSESARVTHVPGDRSSDARGHLGALTGVRFVAAFAVVLDHYATVFISWDPTKGIPSSTAPQPTG